MSVDTYGGMVSEQLSWALHPKRGLWVYVSNRSLSSPCCFLAVPVRNPGGILDFSHRLNYTVFGACVSQMCFLLFILQVQCLGGVCLHGLVQISAAGQLWNFTLFVLSTVSCLAHLKQVQALSFLCFSPDDGRNSLSFLMSKPSEEVLPNFRVGRRLRGWEKDTLLKEGVAGWGWGGVGRCSSSVPKAGQNLLEDSGGCAQEPGLGAKV